MKIRKRASLSFGVACVSLLALNRVAFAACYNSGAGEYCLTNKRYPCPSGCYCEVADGDYGAMDRKGNGQSDIYTDQVDSWCRYGSSCIWSAGAGQCGTSNDAKVFRCPAEFPNSEMAAQTKEDCFAKISDGGSAYTKLYNKTTKCLAGQYLPRNSNSCAACKTGERYYCPGGTFHASTSHDMGLQIKCEAGQYLPGGASSCKKCKTSSRYYFCPGGIFASYLSDDQGIRKCTGDFVANSDRTACEDAKGNLELIKSLYEGTISVPAGKYLPAGKKSPATCRGTTNYCPGGDFNVASVDQGIEACPPNTRANKDKTACSKVFTKIQMQYGPNGKDTPYTRQCWLKTDSAEDFKSCVFGTK